MKLLPNFLTLLRVALIPFLVFLLNDPTPLYQKIALGVFVFGALTDWLDGYLARKHHAVSDFGKLLDPVADKLIVMTVLVMLVGVSDSYGRSWVQPWIVVLILARETWVTGLRAFASSKGLVIPAGNLGKIKTFLQMFGIAFLICHGFKLFSFLGYRITADFFGNYLILLSIFFSYYAAADYTSKALEFD